MSLTLPDQNCPLCDNLAECKSVDHGNILAFNCAICTTFQISVGAIKRLGRAPADWKSALSAQAKNHPYSSTLVVTLPNLTSDSISQALDTSYVKNDELLR